MRTYSTVKGFLLVIFALFNFVTAFSQVGINTTTPRKTLEVAGDMRVTNAIDIGNYRPLNDGEESNFLIQGNLFKIRSMDVSRPTGSALGYIQDYVIVNPNLDWVLDFDTQISSTDYILIAISAYYDRELITSTGNNAEDNASLPYTATFIKNGTWHIIADYPSAANRYTSQIGTWTISTLIYSKDLSKQLGTINIPMGNSTTGSAVTPIID